MECVKISDITKSVCTGLNPRKNFTLNTKDANNYYVTVKEITSNKVVFSESTDKVNDDGLKIIQNRSHLEKGDVLFSGIGTIGKVAYIDFDTNNWNCSESVFILKPNDRILGSFLFYVLQSQDVVRQYEANSAGSIMKGVRKSTLVNITFPLPPLAVQKKIVEILDTFTGMIDNLQKELEQRQKQFEHYRDQMLTFKEGEVQMKPIKEIGKLVRGNGLQKKDFTEDGTGCIHYGQIYTRFGLSTSSTLTFVDSQLAAKLTKVSPGDLVIACTSENIEDVCKSVAWLGKEDIVTGGHACVFKHSENPKYIAYCFTTSAFFLQKRKYAYGAKVIDIKTEKLGEITLPVPSLEKQQEIVDKLDTFEALISNIKQEIELRQKQYEFYREKLLTFE